MATTYTISDLAREFGGAPDFSDIKKFDRYYDFESFDVDTVCSQVVSTIRSALANGSLDVAIQTLGTQPPLVPAAKAVDLLGTKIQDSQASMASSTRRHHMNAAEWKALTAKNRRVWFNPGVRWFAQHIYPVAAPAVRAVRRAGIQV